MTCHYKRRKSDTGLQIFGRRKKVREKKEEKQNND
jgi:hypothetical protein